MVFFILFICSMIFLLIYILNYKEFLKSDSELNYRCCFYISLIWVFSSGFALIYSIFHGVLWWIWISGLNSFFSLLVFYKNIERCNKYRITIKDIRHIVDVYLLIHAELSFDGDDTKEFEQMIRDNKILEINRIVVTRTYSINEGQKNINEFFDHVYGIDIRTWFKNNIDQLEKWYLLSNADLSDNQYDNLKRNRDRINWERNISNEIIGEG